MKPQDGISEKEIKNVLAFNTSPPLVKLRKSDIVDLFERGVSGLPQPLETPRAISSKSRLSPSSTTVARPSPDRTQTFWCSTAIALPASRIPARARVWHWWMQRGRYGDRAFPDQDRLTRDHWAPLGASHETGPLSNSHTCTRLSLISGAHGRKQAHIARECTIGLHFCCTSGPRRTKVPRRRANFARARWRDWKR